MCVSDANAWCGCRHRSPPDIAEQLADAAEGGIDIYFDNIAGPVAAHVLPLMNKAGRYLVCGTIAVNRNLEPPMGPDQLQNMLATVLVKQLRVQGFLFNDFLDMTHEFRRDMSRWIANKEITYQEDIVEDLDNAPDAFLGLFQGKNRGKLLVELNH